MPNLLRKNMRARNRYLVFKARSGKKHGRNSVQKEVQRTHSRLYGEAGSSRHNLWFILWDEKQQKGVVKADHHFVDEVRAALSMVSEIDSNPAYLETILVSGTLKKAKTAHGLS